MQNYYFVLVNKAISLFSQDFKLIKQHNDQEGVATGYIQSVIDDYRSYLENNQVTIIADNNLFSNLMALVTDFESIPLSSLTIHSWEAILTQQHLVKENVLNALDYQKGEWLVKYILSPLSSNASMNETISDSELYEQLKNLENERKDLQQKIDELVNELDQLKNQHKNDSQRVEMLASFLPIIYRNFWHKVKPSDLALIASSYQEISVPSPFPEPSADTILIKKKQLLALSENEKNELISICNDLPSYLEVRPEFKGFLDGGK